VISNLLSLLSRLAPSSSLHELADGASQSHHPKTIAGLGAVVVMVVVVVVGGGGGGGGGSSGGGCGGAGMRRRRRRRRWGLRKKQYNYDDESRVSL